MRLISVDVTVSAKQMLPILNDVMSFHIQLKSSLWGGNKTKAAACPMNTAMDA